MSYAEWQAELVPPWLAGRTGIKFQTGHGNAMDELRERIRQCVVAQFPSFAPSDALPHIGGERGIDRGPGDTDDSMRALLLRAWELWAYGGAHLGMHRALYAAGFTNAVIVQQIGICTTYDGTTVTAHDLGLVPWRSRGGWVFDTREDLWSRFGIVFTTDPGTLYTLEQHETLRRLVNKWKPSKAVFMGAWILTAGGLWGYPISTWGTGTWGSSNRYFIAPTEYDWSVLSSEIVERHTADSLAGADASAVGSWSDSGANGYTLTQSDAAKKPILKLAVRHGHNVVRFDGSNDCMATSAWGAAHAHPLEVLAVVKAGTIGVGDVDAVCDGIVGGTDHFVALDADGTVYASAGTLLNTGAQHATPGDWNLLHARFDGASSEMLINGTSVKTGDTGANAMTGLTVGAYANGTQAIQGDIAELLVTSELSYDKRTALVEYLRLKYRT